MSYCINPWCQHRENQDNAVVCQKCQSPLLINNRYQLIKPLRDCNHPYTEIFEVADLQEEGNFKVLKVLIHDGTHVTELFEQEYTLLISLQRQGIPQAEATFSLELNEGHRVRCLVMERIEGKNLEQYLEQHGAISEEKALDWLQQLAEILDFIHQNDWFHRDIKPSNIMLQPDEKLVLIDFGTAREVTDTVINGRRVTKICSYGYTAPEQIAYRAVPQSDFYALGRTFVHLLTGQYPDAIDVQHWQQMTRYRISKIFADLIESLMELDPKKRPQNAKVILQRLQWIRRFGAIPPRSVVGGSVLLAGKAIAWAIARSNVFNSTFWAFSKSAPVSSLVSCQISSPSAQDYNSTLEEHLSSGQKILLSGFSPGRSNKQKGVESIAARDYDKAVNWLEQAWNKERDPETLIYLNNAQINAQKTSNAPIYTIAVVAPLNGTPDGTSNTGKDILQGVAQAQHQAIKQGFNLKVLIADDANKQEQARQIAKVLVKKYEILGVIGHYASDITIPVVPIYQQHQLVLISPSSSSSQLSSEGTRPDRVFFRTSPTTQLMAQSLVNYLTKQAGGQTVAIFYNHQSQFGRSIREQFVVNFLASGGKVVEDRSCEELSLGSSKFNPTLALNHAQQQKATVLAIFPDGNTNPYTFQNALDLIEESQDSFWILGVSSLHAANTLRQVGNYALNRFVLHVHWHPLSSTNEFPREAQTYWQENVDWKTATSYDATWALIAALKKQSQPSRTGVQKVLADPNFKVTGATGTISFNGSDRKEPINVLLKVVRSNCNDSGYTFVPMRSQKV